MKKIVLIAQEDKDYSVLIEMLENSFPGIEVQLLRKNEEKRQYPCPHHLL